MKDKSSKTKSSKNSSKKVFEEWLEVTLKEDAGILDELAKRDLEKR